MDESAGTTQWESIVWEVAVQGEPGELGLEELEEMLEDGETI